MDFRGGRGIALRVGNIELPAGGVVGEIVFGPGQHHARADGVEHGLRRTHKRHFVLGAGSGVERTDPRLVVEVYLGGGAFEDDYIIAGFKMDGYGGVLGQIAGFARSAGGTEVKGSVKPKTPDGNGVRTAIGAGGADPVVARVGKPLFGVTEGKVLRSRFEAIHGWNVGQTGAAACGIG
jgi:hypothetical protein